MSIDQQVIQIAAEVMGVGPQELELDAPLRDWGHKTTINDETCLALNINISTQSASQCRSIAEYLDLVKTTC
ncbi:hypothetical protein E9531_12955 [Lampropedia puyangensis]|uniref:Acyl carrier protein n=1 Tax=Lampropedia puyangensis TaxID=1330072 RepID=A0A4S8EW12_9BURK|nr:acyl carrier protein [Lampropedia puyangensis]THT98992.1 hypothetical protein E9531_12955 [Lampropedia puyangensis]